MTCIFESEDITRPTRPCTTRIFYIYLDMTWHVNLTLTLKIVWNEAQDALLVAHLGRLLCVQATVAPVQHQPSALNPTQSLFRTFLSTWAVSTAFIHSKSFNQPSCWNSS